MSRIAALGLLALTALTLALAPPALARHSGVQVSSTSQSKAASKDRRAHAESSSGDPVLSGCDAGLQKALRELKQQGFIMRTDRELHAVYVSRAWYDMSYQRK